MKQNSQVDSGFKLPDGMYDKLIAVVLYAIPALGTLYFGLAQIWGFPYGEEVVGTLVAIETFLGVVLGVSRKNYIPETEGSLNFQETDPTEEFLTVQLDKHVFDLQDGELVTFRINKASSR